MVIIGILLMLLLFAGMGFGVYFAIKKTDPNKTDTSVKDSIDNAQEYLPFHDIKDSMVHLGDHKYRAIIECNSVNYRLKTDKEQQIIELTFQRLLNSLSFPISFFVQTRTIDNTRQLELLINDLQSSVDTYHVLEEYANVYYYEMSELHKKTGNNKQKRKYIVVPFEEALELTSSNNEEKYEYSAKELYTRCQIIIDGLNAIGIKGKILNTKEIIELMTSTYHRNNYRHSELINNEYSDAWVNGEENPLVNVTSEGKLDFALYEAQIRIQTEILNNNGVEDEVRKNAEITIEELNMMRKRIGQLLGMDKEKEEMGG